MSSKNRNSIFENYNKQIYIEPYLIVNNVVFGLDNIEVDNYRKMPEKVLKVLLIKRDYESDWELPGGFIYKDDDIQTAAQKKLQEKTGIEDIYMEQLYTFGEKDRDTEYRCVSVCYMSLINKVNASPNKIHGVEDVRWFEISSNLIKHQKTYEKNTNIYSKDYELTLKDEELKLSAVVRYIKTIKNNIIKRDVELIEKSSIAYDHAQIIHYALNNLVNKLETTDIVFGLMKEKFTLMELQQVFEAILNKTYTKSNFQRKIKPFLIETDEYFTGAGFRPAKLYKINPEWDENE